MSQGGWGPQNPQNGNPGQQPYGAAPFGGQPQQSYGSAPQQPYAAAPQQPYGGQPGFSTPYNPQGAYGAGAAPGPYGSGFSSPHPPAKGGSSTKLIVIVVAVVLVLGLVGGAVALLSKKSTPADPGVTQETPTRSATTAPTASTKSTTATTKASATTKATTSTTTSSGGDVTLSNGVSVTPAAGWTVEDNDGDTVTITNGKAYYYAMAVTGISASTKGSSVADAYLASVAKKLTDVSKATTEDVDVVSTLSVAEGALTGTYAGSSGSQKMGVVAIASVRVSDGVTFLGVLIYSASSSTSDLKEPFSTMSTSALKSQAS